MLKVVIGILVVLGLVIVILFKLGTTPHQILFSHLYGSAYKESFAISENINKSRLLVLAPMYNTNVQIFRERVQHLVEGFDSYKIYLYGLDSTDPLTIEGLRSYATDYPDKVVLVPALEVNEMKKLPRTVRIGRIRNELLQAALKDSENKENDPNTFVLVYDADHIGPMSKQGLLKAIDKLQTDPEVFAVSASGSIGILPGIHLLYDHFARREQNRAADSWEKPILHWTIPKWWKLDSSFSGAALYRYKQFIQGDYAPVERECEHVAFHQRLQKRFGGHMVQSRDWHIYVGIQPSNH